MVESRRTIKQMAELAGVSARTLRYYETVGLLLPERTDAGYRVYGERDAKRIAQILAMKACGLPLGTIKRICAGQREDILPTLKGHLALLERQSASAMDALRRTRAAIAALERMEPMEVEDQFERMKKEGIAQFEEEYGQEARERYGSDAIEGANARMMGLTRDEWDAKELLEESIKVQLRLALASGDPTSEAACELVHMHRRWITIHWGEGYSEEAYRGLVHGYLADPRFVKYYDSAAGEGATAFLVEAVDAIYF